MKEQTIEELMEEFEQKRLMIKRRLLIVDSIFIVLEIITLISWFMYLFLRWELLLFFISLGIGSLFVNAMFWHFEGKKNTFMAIYR